MLTTPRALCWFVASSAFVAVPAMARQGAAPQQEHVVKPRTWETDQARPRQQPQQRQSRQAQPQQSPRGQQQPAQRPAEQLRRQASSRVRTIANLKRAIQGESDAAARYDHFARRAEEEGHPRVAKLFRAAAVSERIHCRNEQNALRQLGIAPPPVEARPVLVRDTRRNLLVPIRGERKEAKTMYPRYIEIALEENAPAAAKAFRAARDTEALHDALFKRALANLGHNPNVNYYAQTDTGMLMIQPAPVVTARK